MNFQYPVYPEDDVGEEGPFESRAIWQMTRARMEETGRLQSTEGPRSTSGRRAFIKYVGMFNLGRFPAPFSHLHEVLVRRAKNIHLVRRQVRLTTLPAQFDGYTIVHLSDPHFDSLPGLEKSICGVLSDVTADILVITGDFVDRFYALPEAFSGPLATVLSSLKIRDGIFAVLGNHDSWKSVKALESLGIRVLINESARICRNGADLVFTGVDDPSCFFTPHTLQALENSPGGFKVLLAHSVDLADVAAKAGYALYLAGHTHGGQICLPNGRALHVDLKRFRDLHEGLWSYEGIMGHTSIGAGTSLLPYRLFKRGEVTALTLRCSTGN